MYWSFDYKDKKYYAWGKPRVIAENEYSNLRERFDVEMYNGAFIEKGDKVLYSMQGSSDLGLGDSIWLISFLRDIYSIKSRRRAEMNIYTSEWVKGFWGNFLPKSFNFLPDFIPEKDFHETKFKLPSMYYWKDMKDESDRSWTDNKSLLHRLYDWTGMEYNGLPDFGDFTNEKLLYPSKDFYEKYKLNPEDKYVFFQWHSSSETKNLPPSANIKIIKHIVEKYGLKVIVVGRLRALDVLSNIKGVINLSGKTEGDAEALITLAFNSEFIVCPDSAGVHLSEAFRIPSVCLMSSLPPSYICSKYRIPTFMYGSGHCPFAPCGVIGKLPKETKCPVGTKNYCRVYDEIDLELFDRCVAKSFNNRRCWRNRNIKETINFYGVQKMPITVEDY
jgi:hypothetical protein